MIDVRLSVSSCFCASPKLIADGRARLAAEQAVREFHEKKAEAKRTADHETITNKMQMMLVPTAELTKTKRSAKE